MIVVIIGKGDNSITVGTCHAYEVDGQKVALHGWSMPGASTVENLPLTDTVVEFFHGGERIGVVDRRGRL